MSPHESFDSWGIPTAQLTGPRKTGGLTNLGGIAFQEAYACLYLARLLGPGRQVAAVRYEGAQDLDLLYADTSEEYVQIKNEPGVKYTLVELRPVLQGFAADLLESARKETLRFRLVARSNDTDAAVERLRRGDWSEKDLDKVAHLLAESVKGAPAPKCLRDLGRAERRDLAERLLGRLAFSFGMGDEVDGDISFRSHACVELAKNGVASAALEDAFEALRAALKPQRTYAREDVLNVLKRFIGGAGIGEFGGRVEALTDALLSKPATPEEVMRFYRGEALLDWPIIAAGGDIERDQLEELLGQLSPPPAGLRLVCLVAEPGAGKSTVARRAAAELLRRHDALVIRLKAKEDADVWYRLPDFGQKVGCPFYVLADDLFRFPEVVTALGELDAELPVTILATSRTNEYQPPRIKGELIPIHLKNPSADEKHRILERLGKRSDELTPEQHTRLDAASQFLVLMMETTEGKELSKIVEDALKWLRRHDDPAYRAYEYVSFSYQHSLLIPESLLARLDDRGRFHNLPNRPSTRGLIFYDEDIAGRVRASHPVFAAAAAEHYAALRDPTAVLREFVSAASPSAPWERRFIAHLFRVLAKAKSPVVHAALPHLAAQVTTLQQHATISDLTIWRTMYKALGENELAEGCLDRALTLKPASALDCYQLYGIFRERGREREALPPLSEWFKSHPESNGGQEIYLNLIESYGTKEEIEAAIAEFDEWLALRPDNLHVRTQYLGLVERRGSRSQIEQVLRLTDEWLAQHPDDAHVRTQYIGLAERQGSQAQVEQLIRETGEWLTLHPDDVYVRASFFRLMERRGTQAQVEQLLRETGDWLVSHPDDSTVRASYLGLVEKYGSQSRVEQLLRETGEWLKLHPDDVHVRASFFALMERQGKRALAADTVLEMGEWLALHPEDDYVRGTYISLLASSGSTEQARRAIRETREWLALHPDDVQVRPPFLKLVEKHGGRVLVPQVIQETREWLASHPDDARVRETYLGVVGRRGSREQVTNALRETRAWVASHPDEFTVRASYFGLVERHGGKELVDDVIRETKEWLRSHPEAKSIWEALLALLFRSGKAEEAADMASLAVSHHPDFGNITSQYVRALRVAEDEEAVRESFEKLMENFPDNERIPLNFAAWLTRHNRLAEARAVYVRLLESHPGDTRVHYGYGRLLLKEESYGEAATEFHKVIRARREHQSAHDGLAQALSKAGEIAEREGKRTDAENLFALAEREFRRAIDYAKIAGHEGMFYGNLGWFYLARGRHAEAATAFESAIAKTTEIFTYYWGLGRARLGLGQHREAEAALLTALEKSPEELQPPASEEIPELLRQCREAAAGSNAGGAEG